MITYKREDVGPRMYKNNLYTRITRENMNIFSGVIFNVEILNIARQDSKQNNKRYLTYVHSSMHI